MSTSSSDIMDAVSAAESFRVERTTSETNTDKFGEAICAFANDLAGSGLPGYLVIGVDDQSGAVSGVTNPERLSLLLASLREEGRVLPPPTMVVETLDMEGGRRVVVAKVMPSDRPPVRYKGRVHVRIAARRGLATVDDERVLAERAIDRTRTWDLRACPDAAIDDLAIGLFANDYLPNAVASDVLKANGRSVEEQLSALRFFDLRRQRPTNAGILCFGKDPTIFVPGGYIQFVSYAGTDQASEVIEEARFFGDLSNVLRSLDELARRLERRRPLRLPDLSEKIVADYPALALRELFMNAVVHRNYDASTAPVQINKFADRIEILNPGSLFGELASGGFPGATAYRNPVLAEAAKTLGFVNRFGRGLPIVRDELARNESPPVDIQASPTHFLAVVRVKS